MLCPLAARTDHSWTAREGQNLMGWSSPIPTCCIWKHPCVMMPFRCRWGASPQTLNVRPPLLRLMPISDKAKTKGVLLLPSQWFQPLSSGENVGPLFYSKWLFPCLCFKECAQLVRWNETPSTTSQARGWKATVYSVKTSMSSTLPQKANENTGQELTQNWNSTTLLQDINFILFH